MSQVLRKSQAPKADRFSINHKMFKNDRIVIDAGLEERIAEQQKVKVRHNLVTEKAINTALNYCSSNVKDLMFPIKNEINSIKKNFVNNAKN